MIMFIIHTISYITFVTAGVRNTSRLAVVGIYILDGFYGNKN